MLKAKSLLHVIVGHLFNSLDTWQLLPIFFDKEWNLISIILSFVLIPYPHTGINIANCIKAEVNGWSITTKVIIIDFRIALRLGFNKLIMRYNFI